MGIFLSREDQADPRQEVALDSDPIYRMQVYPGNSTLASENSKLLELMNAARARLVHDVKYI